MIEKKICVFKFLLKEKKIKVFGPLLTKKVEERLKHRWKPLNTYKICKGLVKLI